MPASFPTAAQFNAHLRDNLNAAFPLGIDAWTAYTPTLTQLGAVTKTMTYAKYQRIGRFVTVNVLLAITGSGVVANAVLVGLPVTAATSDGAIGSGFIFDASASVIYGGIVDLASTTEVDLLSTSGNGVLGAAVFTAALASGDTLSFSATYEAAT